MAIASFKEDAHLRRLTADLVASGVVRSVVLYGPAAHGDDFSAASFGVLVVLENIDLRSLEAVAGAVGRWVAKGRPMPRLFSPSLLAGAADVFPIELLDLCEHHVVLHGEDPLLAITAGTDHLRLQCERELREKILRLEEAYLSAHRSPRRLRELLATSYVSFSLVFRGCLRLLGGEVPRSALDVHRALARRLELDAASLDEAERAARGERPADARATFERYYTLLQRLVDRIDSFERKSSHA